MINDAVLISGEVAEPTDPRFDPAGRFYIYQDIHCCGTTGTLTGAHWKILNGSSIALYGMECGFSKETLDKEISMILEHNHYFAGSSEIRLYLFPPRDPRSEPVRVIKCMGKLLYHGFTHWHSSFSVLVTPYDIPFAIHRTSVSLNTHRYAAFFATMKGYEAALRVSESGYILDMEGFPVMAIKGRTLIHNDSTLGLPDDVMIEMVTECAKGNGYDTLCDHLNLDSLHEYDELFAINTQGMVSIKKVRDRLFPNTATSRIADAMGKLW